MFRSNDQQQAEKYVTTLGLMMVVRPKHVAMYI
jgi:hypothetical protein